MTAAQSYIPRFAALNKKRDRPRIADIISTERSAPIVTPLNAFC
jgi:hypothetical protein